jgi:hypothetical protein
MTATRGWSFLAWEALASPVALWVAALPTVGAKYEKQCTVFLRPSLQDKEAVFPGCPNVDALLDMDVLGYGIIRQDDMTHRLRRVFSAAVRR